MASLVWGAAIVAAVSLLQLPVVYWLSRHFRQERAVADDPAADLPVAPEIDHSAPGVCPRCGTRNDPDYTYCANCVAPL